MSQIIFERLARRRVMPEKAAALALAVKIGHDLAGLAPGDILSDTVDNRIFDLLFAFEPLAKMVLYVEENGHRRVAEGQEPGVKAGFLRTDAEAVLPDLPEPTAEDVLRLLDLVALNPKLGCVHDLRCLAPSYDPVEAAGWILKAAALADLDVRHDSFRTTLPQPPYPPTLGVDQIYGNCPVQADGDIGDTRFYYRARGERQTFETDDGFSMSEPVLIGPYAAGWLTEEEALLFIKRAAMAYERQHRRV